MSCIATWLRGSEIVAEEEFEDLAAAKDAVLGHLRYYQERMGVNAVKVWDERAIYFQVDAGDL
jgi:hypothetical protein